DLVDFAVGTDIHGTEPARASGSFRDFRDGHGVIDRKIEDQPLVGLCRWRAPGDEADPEMAVFRHAEDDALVNLGRDGIPAEDLAVKATGTFGIAHLDLDL